jgi:hypothetical protein
MPSRSIDDPIASDPSSRRRTEPGIIATLHLRRARLTNARCHGCPELWLVADVMILFGWADLDRGPQVDPHRSQPAQQQNGPGSTLTSLPSAQRIMTHDGYARAGARGGEKARLLLRPARLHDGQKRVLHTGPNVPFTRRPDEEAQEAAQTLNSNALPRPLHPHGELRNRLLPLGSTHSCGRSRLRPRKRSTP